MHTCAFLSLFSCLFPLCFTLCVHLFVSVSFSMSVSLSVYISRSLLPFQSLSRFSLCRRFSLPLFANPLSQSIYFLLLSQTSTNWATTTSRALTQRRKAQVFLDDAADQERPVTPPPSPPTPATLTTTAARPEIGALPSASPIPSYSLPAPESLPLPYPEDLTTSYEDGLFCSELVAALYQRLGLFDAPYPARHDYVPADFSPPAGALDDIGGGGATKVSGSL